jgi:hypothetical protein
LLPVKQKIIKEVGLVEASANTEITFAMERRDTATVYWTKMN